MVRILPTPTAFSLGIAVPLRQMIIIYSPQLAVLREDQVACVSLPIAVDFGIVTRWGPFNLVCRSLG